jgi:hypothetical protein
MSGVFQNIDPLTARRVGGGGEVNILKDARHYSVLNKCTYFVTVANGQQCKIQNGQNTEYLIKDMLKRSPGIDYACVAWRASRTTLFLLSSTS